MKKNIVPVLVCVLLFAQCSKKDATPTPTNNLNAKSVGASAKELLASASYSSLKIILANEIDKWLSQFKKIWATRYYL